MSELLAFLDYHFWGLWWLVLLVAVFRTAQIAIEKVER